MLPRILCLIILLLEIRALSISLPDRGWSVLKYYTHLSNLLTTASVALLLVFGQPYWITVLRYVGTCMLVMTFFVTVFVLVPMGADPKAILWSGSGLYHHILCPVISTAGYILLEHHAPARLIWLPAVLTLLYGLVMLYLNWLKKVDGPYPFFRIHNQTAAKTVMWMVVLFAAVTIIDTAVWAFAR